MPLTLTPDECAHMNSVMLPLGSGLSYLKEHAAFCISTFTPTGTFSEDGGKASNELSDSAELRFSFAAGVFGVVMVAYCRDVVFGTLSAFE